MKKWNLIASVILVLVGFCAGVGLNLLPMSTTVRGAPGDPNPALKSVAHDATLAGDGTLSAPLAVANGGISAPKLSAAAPPSTGQLLGFNGANLAWQDAPIGGVRAVDSVGHLVGPFIGPGTALRQVGSFLFLIGVTTPGFDPITPANKVALWHTTTDCSGPRYFGARNPGELVRFSNTFGTQLVYAADPIQEVIMNSYEYITPPVAPNLPGPCNIVNPTPVLAGRVTTLDLNTLGLVPPFHLEF